jgi:hypothetical protein
MRLKKLFSPRSLGATIATGMLFHATYTALAAGYYYVSAVPLPGNCQAGVKCTSPNNNPPYYWCCQPGSTCVGSAYYDPGLGSYIGWCYQP